MNAILTKLRGIRMYLYVGLAGLVLSVATYNIGLMKGHADEKVTQAEARAAGTLEGVNTHDKVTRQVGKMSDPDIDGELTKWMRD